jgi:acyl transferase domain-containing protein/NAD(P)-dependent dehydrogenase (short-subunit alcohol dehydrogenase family)/predicted hotdog family 3-hydroxylacyl-ACP dehydratase
VQLPAELAAQLPEWTEDSFAGILPNVAAGRIANRLNFGGMNVLVDAACASSLAAVYQGVHELTAGRSDLVIAGGIDTVQGPFGYLCFSKTQALSPRGRCSTFDANGDGIVISEGIAMVAMKRLADAERDGDRVYAVIRGVGASSDGNAKGLTAPLPAGQLRAMRRAYAMAGFGPSTVGLFEAHGTGTVAGDTAELESTTRLMQEESSPPRHAVIGSVKTMIGHTKATAGVAGLVKAALALHHRVLPPHRNVTTPNRVLADPSAPLYLVDEAMPWLDGDQPRRAACSAFGFGGTNFHVVMEEHLGEYRDWLRPAGHEAWSAELLVWSESERSSLVSRLEALGDRLADAPALALRDLAASLAARWRPRAETLAIVARSVDDLRSKLTAVIGHARGDAAALPPGIFWGSAATKLQGKVAVLFPGQGSQYVGMGREAALHFEPVARSLSAADAALKEEFGRRFGASTRLSHFVFPRGAYGEDGKAESRRRLTGTDVAQPALGAVEVGLYRLMQQLGLQGDMFAGHSYGEFVALHAAGVLDFDTLMQLSAARGRFIVDAAAAEGAELGTMAAVSASRKVVEDAIADIEGVIIANHNAPTQCIVSGTREAVGAASRKLAQAGIEVTDIPVAAAFHSVLVQPAQQPLGELIEATRWSPATAPVYSNATARPHAADVARVKRQMAEHLVCPVEFVAQIDAMYKDGARLFVEVGPKSVLTRLTARILAGREHVAIAIDDGSGLAGLLGGIAQMLCAGLPVDFQALFARRECRIGDPSDPGSLQRIEPVSKHAWMLNGSAVRRVSEPVRQVGTSLEAVQARAAAAHLAPQPSGLPVRVPPPTPGAPAAAPASPTPVWRRSRLMDERRTPPGGMADAVMSEYFHTMRQFLDTQERVMSTYLGADPAPRAAQPLRARPAPVALARVAEVAPALPVVAAPVRAVTPPAPAPAPIVAPVAVSTPPVVPVPKTAAVPVQAAAAATSATSVGGSTGPMTREALADMLLSIVEEKTGYPRDMVGLDQNLEADLGIDSIKRIEVVGALLQQLPAAYREVLTESRSKLNTQPTLNGMLDLVAQAKVGGAVTVPFDVAGVGSRVVMADHPPRHVVRPMPDPIPAGSARHLVDGCFVITRDALGIAEALAATLAGRGRSVKIVGRDALESEAALAGFCASVGNDRIAGVVHLAALGTPALADDGGPDDWRVALQLAEKSWFLLLRELSGRLVEDAHVLAASGLGGLFGRDGTASPRLTLQSGAVGAVKSLLAERPSLRVKAVDLDTRRSAAEMAADLFAELTLDGGRQEIGYPQGVRTAFVSAPQAVTVDTARQENLKNIVVLATGGARGITAEVLRELAQPGNTLVLTGRSVLPAAEDADTASLPDGDALRMHFVAKVRAGVLKLTPGDIHKRVQTLLALREMRLNIADLQAGGAHVEYHAVDVVDESGLVALLADLHRRFGRVDGVVHGAGVIEDKLLADKRSDSWSRVVETKVLGLLALARHVDASALKFFTVFSSVAGRYGNSGQSDYATANELMNRLCLSLQTRWGPGVVVSALCWGPWGATKFGAGMVTAETEAKFAAKGVGLVTAELGRRLFREELGREAGHAVEVICGAAPWESREVELGVIRAAAAAAPMGALLGCTEASSLPTGERIVPVTLDPKRHLYLQEHALDDTMVLPAAAALEIMAEAARALWPGWQVSEVREHRLMKGVELKAASELQVFLSPPPYGSSEGFDVSVMLRSDLGNGRAMTHYRAVVRLEPMLQTPLAAALHEHAERSLTVAKAYNEWLFHGPRFQVIDDIEGLSDRGASARVHSSTPAAWVAGAGAQTPGWVFDPALIDAAAQMAWLWARAYRDESALPTRFGRVVRYRDTLPTTLRMAYERVPTADATLVRANVWFLDEDGTPVMAIEELDSVASAALNRLGGTARCAVETA